MLYYSIDPDNNFTVTVHVVPINEVGSGEPALQIASRKGEYKSAHSTNKLFIIV